MIRLFIGHDPREAVAYDVFMHSVIQHTTQPVAVTPLTLKSMPPQYGGPTDGSNAFTYSRFLIPWLCDFTGYAIFADGDMLCRADLQELWDLRDPTKAVQVVKHDYKTKHPVKYLGSKNEDYPRKNWSSVVIWNCGHPENAWMHPGLLKDKPGSFLHRFSWLDDRLIGELPAEWNWLVTEYPKLQGASLVHFTLGTPCFKGYEACDYAEEWHATLKDMLAVPDGTGV